MKQTIGGVALGDSFWDREEDLQLFMEKIAQGTHLSLVAQRRMGKTSLMREAARRLENRYIGLYVDLQQGQNAPDAVARLGAATHDHKPLWNRIANVFSNTFTFIQNSVEKVSIFDIGIHLRSDLDLGNWSQKGDALLAILAASEKPVLLMFDEIPIMVNRMLKGQDYTITAERRRETDEFMSWLRRNSLEHQGKICIVLTGSIGFEPVLHQAGLSATLNTFEPFELRPWERDISMGCLNALAKDYGIHFSPGTVEEMVELLGCCIPDHVQMFFAHVYDRCRRKGVQEAHKEDVQVIYQEDMLGVRAHAELTHYEERLKMVLGPELLPLSLDMLSDAAITGRLSQEAIKALQGDYEFQHCSVMEAEMEILRVLEHDGYLREASSGYVFVSNLVRDWWKKRYQLFFTPILQRERNH